MKDPIIGIDLGTTNSCCAFAEGDGQVTLIPYRGGEYTIPSIYAINEKNKELVGYEAKRQWQLNPQQTVHGSKRMLGMDFDTTLVSEVQKHITYEIQRGPNNEVVVPIAGRTLGLPDISAKILEKIRDVAADYLQQPVNQAVVTVPAYFNDRQRQAVREAGARLGLHIDYVINEPTAAALAYGADRNATETVAVYDLGGGTFDISIIEIRDRVFEVKATGGDVFLGGIDFDDALIQYVLNDFQSQHGIDLSVDPIANQRIRDMAERVKVDLSERSEAPMNIPFITMNAAGKPLDIDIVISREELETLVQPLLERTFETCATVMDEVGLTPDQIDQVLLVGGQTRMPLIQERIRGFFGKSPSKSVHPDEAVAIGAAKYAWSLTAQSDRRIQLLDVLPMAIGIERADKQLHRVFERHCPVPNRRQLTFTTHRDQQQDLVMRIFQGDHAVAADNQMLGEFVFSGLRPGPAGSVRVEVVFDVSNEGILSLDAKDTQTGVTMQQNVHFGQS